MQLFFFYFLKDLPHIRAHLFDLVPPLWRPAARARLPPPYGTNDAVAQSSLATVRREVNMTALAAARGRRAHQRCSVLGCPCRIDFSRAYYNAKMQALQAKGKLTFGAISGVDRPVAPRAVPASRGCRAMSAGSATAAAPARR